MPVPRSTQSALPAADGRGGHYKWIALSNTTLGILMVTINQSILLISLPALFRGIKLNPLVPSNTSYFLWVFLGFMLVTAVLVVSWPGRRHPGRVRCTTSRGVHPVPIPLSVT
jgi:quinol-cytochrome oxidoreductase complex cytochrome b subunit